MEKYIPHKYISNISCNQSTPILSQYGDSIINTASIVAYQGNKLLIDYSATKGAIVSFTRSLALSLVSKRIRANGVAPGPIWTPLQHASYPTDYITTFGIDTSMKRAGQPVELAPTYIYLASVVLIQACIYGLGEFWSLLFLYSFVHIALLIFFLCQLARPSI